jgi:hypothetical protein
LPAWGADFDFFCSKSNAVNVRLSPLARKAANIVLAVGFPRPVWGIALYKPSDSEHLGTIDE